MLPVRPVGFQIFEFDSRPKTPQPKGISPMKKLFAALFIAFALTIPVRAQVDTNAPPPILSSPLVDFLSRSNLVVAPYFMYDTTSSKGGGGIALAYKLSDFIVPVFRVDGFEGTLWNMSASLQLQVPIHVLGKFDATPFVFDGIATPFAGKGRNNLEPENIAGIGAAIGFHSSNPWIPKGIVADYERWTGAGFNDNQIRLGAFWKF